MARFGSAFDKMSCHVHMSVKGKSRPEPDELLSFDRDSRWSRCHRADGCCHVFSILSKSSFILSSMAFLTSSALPRACCKQECLYQKSWYLEIGMWGDSWGLHQLLNSHRWRSAEMDGAVKYSGYTYWLSHDKWVQKREGSEQVLTRAAVTCALKGGRQ